MSYTGHGRIIPVLHVQEDSEDGNAPKTGSSSSSSSSSSSFSRNRSCTAGASAPRRHH
ncbi:protein Aster-B isoform X11, partial [Tachysurus ichikawai]